MVSLPACAPHALSDSSQGPTPVTLRDRRDPDHVADCCRSGERGFDRPDRRRSQRALRLQEVEAGELISADQLDRRA